MVCHVSVMSLCVRCARAWHCLSVSSIHPIPMYNLEWDTLLWEAERQSSSSAYTHSTAQQSTAQQTNKQTSLSGARKRMATKLTTFHTAKRKNRVALFSRFVKCLCKLEIINVEYTVYPIKSIQAQALAHSRTNRTVSIARPMLIPSTIVLSTKNVLQTQFSRDEISLFYFGLTSARALTHTHRSIYFRSRWNSKRTQFHKQFEFEACARAFTTQMIRHVTLWFVRSVMPTSESQQHHQRNDNKLNCCEHTTPFEWSGADFQFLELGFLPPDYMRTMFECHFSVCNYIISSFNHFDTLNRTGEVRWGE